MRKLRSTGRRFTQGEYIRKEADKIVAEVMKDVNAEIQYNEMSFIGIGSAIEYTFDDVDDEGRVIINRQQ
jgi:hypothetical protein